MTPFDFINSITYTKEDLFENNDQADADYNQYVVNKGLSYFVDTLFYANEMNLHNTLPKKLQYYFLLNSISKAKRFSKWIKPDTDSKDIALIKEYYKYSDEKARQALTVLTKEQLSVIEKKMYKGGG